MVIEPDAVTRFHDAAAIWSGGVGAPDTVVQAACDVLADGYDGHFLAMLAALPLGGVDDAGVEDLLEQSLAELGVGYHIPRGRDAAEAALAAMARRVLAGSLSPRELTSWTHRAFGHDRLPLAERLSELDDVYDSVDSAETSEEVDQMIITEATKIVARRDGQ